jgi:hypothetical protein
MITATAVVLMINPNSKAARKPRIRAELNHLLQGAQATSERSCTAHYAATINAKNASFHTKIV